ncbi:hypothetical protein ABDJ41_22900, partial [Pedobacter sp. ASV1-7]|uniref:hypothetical protein n=1 Tax=Pedobacter sp. ASV1-7 TaxID=3145237 RepID=UPI0032E9146A
FVQVLMFLVSVSITSTFQSCFSYYQTPFDKPALFGIAKVEIFLVVAKFFKTFFPFYFLPVLNDSKKLPSLHATTQIILLYIPFTVSLPPKRDAKVGK